MIGDGSDPERVAKAAHKAMPLLEMLEPGKNQWVALLQTPGETTTPPNEQERERLTKQLIEKLKEILCDIY